MADLETTPNPRNLVLVADALSPTLTRLQEAFMFQFTDNYGTPVYDAMVADRATLPLVPTDVAHLPLWVAAAKAADEAGYCPVYDEIASTVGGPTRADLREAGLLTRKFRVEVTRNAQVTITFAQTIEVEVEAANPADAREVAESQASDEFEGSIDGYSLREYVNRYEQFDIDDDGDYETGHAVTA